MYSKQVWDNKHAKKITSEKLFLNIRPKNNPRPNQKSFKKLCSKATRPSSDSEAATMYKLKGQSSNMRTGQSFENKELVCLAGPIPLLGLANWLRLIRLG